MGVSKKETDGMGWDDFVGGNDRGAAEHAGPA